MSHRPELKLALKQFQISIFEALLAAADLEEAGIEIELQSYATTNDRRIALKNWLYEVQIEREIIVERLADFDPPLRVLVG